MQPAEQLILRAAISAMDRRYKLTVQSTEGRFVGLFNVEAVDA